jgi:hypothetical protein
MTPPVRTVRAPSNPGGALSLRGWTAAISSSAPMYTAPSSISGCASSKVTTRPVRTSGAIMETIVSEPPDAAQPLAVRSPA